MSQIAENTVEAFARVARTIVNSTRVDQTIDAEIVSLENVDIGEYKVSYQGSIFSAFSDNILSTYRVGERVYILVPQGDFTLKKLIIGRSAFANNMSFAETQAQTNFFIDKGPNWLEAWYNLKEEKVDSEGNIETTVFVPRQQIEITAAPKGTKLKSSTQYKDIAFLRAAPTKEEEEDGVRYPDAATGYLTAADLEIADQRVQDYSQHSEYIKIEADFQTLFQRLPRSKGSYGIRVNCLGYNPDYVGEDSIASGVDNTEEKVKNNYTFELTFPDFIGAPYNYVSPNTQTAYYPVVPGTILGLYSVELYQDGDLDLDCFPSYVDGQTVYDESEANIADPNIFASAIKICFADQISLTDTRYRGWIECPYGNSVWEAKEGGRGQSSVTLIAHLWYGNQEILDPQNCEVYWFRRDPRRMHSDISDTDRNIHNKTWYDYAGPGWMPIGSTVNGRSIEDADQYKVDFNTLVIGRDAIKWQWEYKAVMVYYGSMGDQSIEDPDLREIIRAEATQIVVNSSSPYDLRMRQRNDNNRIYLEVIDLKDMSDKPEGVVLEEKYPNEEWFATWYMSLQDTSYRRISEDWGVRRGEFRIDDQLGNHYGHFYALAYSPYKIDKEHYRKGDDGTYYYLYQEDPIGVVDIEIVSPSADDIEWSWQGQRTFNYDALGNIKLQDHLISHQLTPKVHFKTGAATGFLMTILGPDGEPLKSAAKQEAAHNNQFYDPKTPSMLRQLYLSDDASGTINYKIADKFDYKAAAPERNRFTARLEFGGRVVSEHSYEVRFTKDGDQGTIGNEWSAELWPCNSKYGDELGNQNQQFLNRYALPCPLVLNQVDDGTGNKHWVQNDQFKVFLRPFVQRDGQPLNLEDSYEAYFYRVYWDVRMPGSASSERARYASFLRLYHVDGDTTGGENVGTLGKIFTREDVSGLSGWNQGDTRTYASKTNDAEGLRDGLIAFTQWPHATHSELWAGINPFTYGAVEVRFFDNETHGTKATLSEMQYRFIVKAQVDICKGSYDNFEGKQGINTEGDVETIASINCFYPIDVIFDDAEGTFSKQAAEDETRLKMLSSIDTNWPRWVQYNPTGYMPEVNNDELYFKYTDANGEKLSYAAWNAAPLVATLKTTWDEETGIQQRYQPKPHLNFTEGMHGVLTTTLDVGDGVTYVEGETTEITSGVSDPLFGKGFYLRNQVLYLNQYGNVDINGWDGQGIDMNEDRGTIFATTLGAGYKSPQTNLFTGVLMGADASQDRKTYAEVFGSYSDEDAQSRPYITGLFGYQDGVQSFGLMENGTAFFGKADGGGRIIIDGNNATIYGGANGWLGANSETKGTTNILDPMWNSMRLSFVDFTHAASPQVGAITGYQNRGLSEQQIAAILELDFRRNPKDKNSTKSTYERRLMEGEWVDVPITRPTKDDPNTEETVVIAKVAIETDNSQKAKEESAGFRYDGRYYLNVLLTYEGEQLGPWTVPIKNQKTSYLVDGKGNLITKTIINSKGEEEEVPVMASEQGYLNQGFDGAYYTYNPSVNAATEAMSRQLPSWYGKIWSRAYVKRPGELPYWYETDSTTESEKIKYDELPWYNYELQPDKDDKTQVDNSVKNWKVNYFSDLRLFEGQNLYEEVTEDGKTFHRLNAPMENLSGFGPSRASTTPAIEIGQHPKGLMPGLLDWGDYEEVFKNLSIPGDRNFMVTYDGTLWAMNGVFMGVIIGSNIVGGRIQGAEIGIGRPNNPNYQYYRIDRLNKNGKPSNKAKCDPAYLLPPRETIHQLDENGAPNVAFYVDAQGSVTANNVNLYGGRIDVGRFHIMGRADNNPSSRPSDDKEYGHLVQIAESDFVGETHFFGNAFVAPTIVPFADGEYQKEFNLSNSGSSQGNMAQVYGTVALGIPVTKLSAAERDQYETPDGKHSLKIWDAYYSKIFNKNSTDTNYAWTGTRELDELPPIGWVDDLGRPRVESSAMFGLCSSKGYIPTTTKPADIKSTDQKDFMGHFWPLHFHYGWSEPQVDPMFPDQKFIPVNAYVTTMDLFQGRSFSIRKKDAGTTGNPDYQSEALRLVSSNYFRIGPYGSEGQRHWIRANFQSELSSEKPVSDNDVRQANYLGWFGLVNRNGNPNLNTFEQFAIGMQSWYSAPIIFKSDGEAAWDARGHMRLAAGGHGSNWSMNGQTWKGPEYYGTTILMGTNMENQQANTPNLDVRTSIEMNRMHLLTAGGPIKIGVVLPYAFDSVGDTPGAFKDYGLQSSYIDPSPTTINEATGKFECPMGVTLDPTGLYTGGILGNHGDSPNVFLDAADPIRGQLSGGGVPGIMLWGSEDAEVHIFRRPPKARLDALQNEEGLTGHNDNSESNISELWLGTSMYKGGGLNGNGAIDKEVALLTAQDGIFLGLKTPTHQILDYGDELTRGTTMVRIEDYSILMAHPQLIEFTAGGKQAAFATSQSGFGMSMYWNPTQGGEENRNIKFGYSVNETTNGYFHGHENGIRFVGTWAKPENQQGIYARFA